MNELIEADRLLNSLSFRLFGRRREDIIELYNKSIFVFTNNEQIDMVEFVYRRLIDVDSSNKINYLQIINNLKPTDVSVIEELAHEYSKRRINPWQLYYDYANRTNNIEYYKKSLRFIINDDDTKENITQRIRELENPNIV